MDVKGKKVSVIGAKRSGIAAAGLLAGNGASVFVSELGSLSAEEEARLLQLGVSWEQEGHSGRVCDADFCVVSPGIPRSAAVVRMVLAEGIPLFSEIEVASWFCRASVAGITGTDGKTTTSTLLCRIAEEDGIAKGYRAFSAGNIGVPFSALVQEMSPGDVAVVELSSYQLEGCESFRPNVAVITNITPDHLDRYGGDMHAYAAAKFRIYAAQQESDTLIYNYDDPVLREHFGTSARVFPFRVVPFGIGDGAVLSGASEAWVFQDGVISLWKQGRHEPVLAGEEFLKSSFRGSHNIYNALAAVAAADALGISREAVRIALGGFCGVEHRQEFVRTLEGVDWVNDSKATNINALLQALIAVPGRIVLIAGGRDKGNDYSVLVPVVSRKVSCVIAIGEAKEKICRAFEGITATVKAESLEEAVWLARHAAHDGDTVLFSPGCASFDMFENFEERGRLFKHYIRSLGS